MPGQVVASGADNRLEVFVVGGDGGLWHIWQTLPNNGWSNWVSHGTPGNLLFTSPPAVIRNRERRLELFIAGSDGHISHIWQPTPNGAWSNWWVHDGPPNGVQGAPAVGINQDGRLEVFVVERGSHWLYSQPQTAPSNGWAPNWFNFGAPPNVRLASSPAVGANADGRLEVFVVGSDGLLWKKDQTAPNNGWSDWLPHGAPSNGVRWNNSPVVTSNADGRLELFMVGTDRQLWHEWQTAPNSGWSRWESLGSPPAGLSGFGAPALGSNAAIGWATGGVRGRRGRLLVAPVADRAEWRLGGLGQFFACKGGSWTRRLGGRNQRRRSAGGVRKWRRFGAHLAGSGLRHPLVERAHRSRFSGRQSPRQLGRSSQQCRSVRLELANDERLISSSMHRH